MPATGLSSQDFRLGDWLVRPRLARIERGGSSVHVTPRSMAVLVHLAAAGGDVVSRNDILDAVWPRMAVTPDALSRCLVELRKAFGDGANGQRVLETIPKVGVRVTLPVVPVAPELPGEPLEAGVRAVNATLPQPRWARYATAALAAVVATAIAAFSWPWLTQRETMPTQASTDTEALAYFSSALEYSQRPNRVEALPHEEALYGRAVEEDPSFARAWAGLGHAHMGSYWYNIDRTPTRLALAEEALRRALALEPELPEAHLYLADFYHKGHGDSAAALAEFAIAERGLPTEPELYFLRSTVHRRAGQWALAAADGKRATELGADRIVYWRQLHVTYCFMRDFERAEQVLDRILTLAPDDGTTYVDKVALALQRAGDTTLAKNYESRPPSALYDEGLAYGYTAWLAAVFDRDYDRALGVLAEISGDRVFNGDLRTSLLPKAALRARTYRLAGDAVNARAGYEAVLRDTEPRLAAPSATSDDALSLAALYLMLAEAQAALGQPERALETLARALEVLPKSADAVLGSAVQLAAVLNVLVPAGETAAAVRELDDYLGAAGHWGAAGLRADPRLDALRSDPGWTALVATHARQ